MPRITNTGAVRADETNASHEAPIDRLSARAEGMYRELKERACDYMPGAQDYGKPPPELARYRDLRFVHSTFVKADPRIADDTRINGNEISPGTIAMQAPIQESSQYMASFAGVMLKSKVGFIIDLTRPEERRQNGILYSEGGAFKTSTKVEATIAAGPAHAVQAIAAQAVERQLRMEVKLPNGKSLGQQELTHLNVPVDDHHGMPANDLLQLATHMRDWRISHPGESIAIHCKAGVGRTAMPLIMERLLNRWDRGLLTEANLDDTVKQELRYIRCKRSDVMLQSADQFKTVLGAARELLRRQPQSAPPREAPPNYPELILRNAQPQVPWSMSPREFRASVFGSDAEPELPRSGAAPRLQDLGRAVGRRAAFRDNEPVSQEDLSPKPALEPRQPRAAGNPELTKGALQLPQTSEPSPLQPMASPGAPGNAMAKDTLEQLRVLGVLSDITRRLAPGPGKDLPRLNAQEVRMLLSAGASFRDVQSAAERIGARTAHLELLGAMVRDRMLSPMEVFEPLLPYLERAVLRDIKTAGGVLLTSAATDERHALVGATAALVADLVRDQPMSWRVGVGKRLESGDFLRLADTGPFGKAMKAALREVIGGKSKEPPAARPDTVQDAARRLAAMVRTATRSIEAEAVAKDKWARQQAQEPVTQAAARPEPPLRPAVPAKSSFAAMMLGSVIGPTAQAQGEINEELQAQRRVRLDEDTVQLQARAAASSRRDDDEERQPGLEHLFLPRSKAAASPGRVVDAVATVAASSPGRAVGAVATVAASLPGRAVGAVGAVTAAAASSSRFDDALHLPSPPRSRLASIDSLRSVDVPFNDGRRDPVLQEALNNINQYAARNAEQISPLEARLASLREKPAAPRRERPKAVALTEQPQGDPGSRSGWKP